MRIGAAHSVVWGGGYRVMSDAFHRSLVAELTRAGVAKAGFSNS